jgi:hypothetical protein
MSFNVWQPQGNVVANPGAGVMGNPSVIYDTNPVVLVGHTNVFKMWAGVAGTGNIYYFESLDGLTSWTAYSGNPITLGGTTSYVPTVYKQGSTYYLYTTQSSLNFGITVFTSTDGVTFVKQGSGNQIPVGGVGAWDHNGCFQLNLADVIGGTWYGYYSGYNGTKYGQGLVTSTDGINWTKSVNNPIFPGPIGNGGFLKAGGVYYFYAPFFSTVAAFNNNYRIGRWSSTSPSGPWTPLTFNGVQVSTYYLATATELGNGSGGVPQNGPNDQYFCVANGNIYLYYTLTSPGGNELNVSAALASGVTPAQLTATYEGVFNVPPTGTPELNLAIIGTDNFQRANANPIGGNWTQLSAIGTFGPNALVSNTMEAASLATVNAASYWNASSFNNDQWSKITISQIGNSSASVFATLRNSTVGAQTLYRFGPSGAALGSSCSFNFQKDVAGSFTNILSIPLVTFNVGDTITAVAVGTNLYVYLNDNLFYVISDASLTSGPVGAETAPNSTLSSAAISAWSGGNLQAAPPPPPVSLAYSVPDCRLYGNFPNHSVNVNGTLTYTVPSVDSRKAGAPVDSRTTTPTASGTYPQNSRTPGIFGPGE